MKRKCNNRAHQKLNVRGQTAGCKASSFLKKYNIVFALQSTVVKFQEWKNLEKQFSVEKKIGVLLINSKVTNKYVSLNRPIQTSKTPSSLSWSQNQSSNVEIIQNFPPHIDPTNTFLTDQKKKIEQLSRINLFQASTLLIGCDSQQQVSDIFELIINNKNVLLPSFSSSMTQKIFPWLNCKLRYLRNQKILVGGIHKRIKYSHLDFYQQNNKNSMTYPNFRDSLLKKIALFLTIYLTFFQQTVASTTPSKIPISSNSLKTNISTSF